MKIAFVVTNYNNTQFTEDAVDSIHRFDKAKNKIIIVDNKSTTNEVDLLKSVDAKHPNVDVIYNETNVGYFGGLNLGIKYLRQHYPECEYVVIGNNDVLFPVDFPNMIEKKLDLFTKYPIVSPDIVTSDGFHQNPHVINKISKKREFIYDLYHLNYYLACGITKLAKYTHSITDRKDEEQYEIAQEIYQGYGACYILGPLFFEYFDELWAPTFLMYEEFFLSKQLSDKGFNIFYEPSISLTHLLHASTSQLPAKQKWKFSQQAHKEYRKYIKVFSKNGD
tara:strand:- start:210423 stop:211259 length:837 start_codon:yes stop_codon:yes gene_type:complete